jgi:hypothetical protein
MPMPLNNKQARHNARQGTQRHARYALRATLGLIVVISTAAFVANPFALLQSRASSDRSSDGAATDDQTTSTIIFEVAPHQCKHVMFDNNGGGPVSEGLSSCEDDVVLDAQGKPIPMATKHRLDAISKSFAHGGD